MPKTSRPHPHIQAMVYDIASYGHGDWKSSDNSVVVRNEAGQMVAWFAWRHSYHHATATATFVDETTQKHAVHYFPPIGFPGDLWDWFVAQCQARYGLQWAA